MDMVFRQPTWPSGSYSGGASAGRVCSMAYFPKSHSSKRAPRCRVSEAMPILFSRDHGEQIRGRLCEISDTGGSAEMDSTLPASTLVSLTLRTAEGQIAAVAEMLPAVSTSRQPFRFIALDESDRANLVRLVSN